MVKKEGDGFVIWAVTIMWLVVVPGLPWLFVNGLGWPLSFALAIFIPIFLVFIPSGYLLSIIGNHQYRHMEGLYMSGRALAKMAVLGLLTGSVCMAAIWAFGLWEASNFMGASVAGLIGVSLLGVAYRMLSLIARDLRVGGS